MFVGSKVIMGVKCVCAVCAVCAVFLQIQTNILLRLETLTTQREKRQVFSPVKI